MSTAMEEASWWPEIGFRDNLYDTWPLTGDQDARELLVGREGMWEQVMVHLKARTAHLTIDAPNGGGKTSLIQCILGDLEDGVANHRAGQLLVPVKEPLSFGASESVAEFEEKALLRLASTLVQNRQVIRRASGFPGDHLDELGKFINAPSRKGGGLGANVAGFGVSGTVVPSFNQGFGFQRIGLMDLLQRSLTEAFPADASGCLVACIDNVETLGERARVWEFMDAIRDQLLRLHGVKWIVLGADGILDGIGYGRLSGVLTPRPKTLERLSPEQAAEVVERRIQRFRLGTKATVPVSGTAFQAIYESCGMHLRSALEMSEDFSTEAELKGLLSSDAPGVIVGEGEDRWIRQDLDPVHIKSFLARQSLYAWDEVDVMGAPARDLLIDLQTLGSASENELGAGKDQRIKALQQLCEEKFVISVGSNEDRGRIRMELTARGTLAVTGSRLAD
ncbi:MAG TPA: hypothetical protein VF030_05330 [Solirubrobacterales bacterium]